jgi:hypothetical protein
MLARTENQHRFDKRCLMQGPDKQKHGESQTEGPVFVWRKPAGQEYIQG